MSFTRWVDRLPDTSPAPRDASAAIERWDVDLSRSRLTFRLRHIIVQRIDGHFARWGGALFIDRHDPSSSSGEIWIDLASIDTGDAGRDAHIRSSEFLDVSRFPRAEFRSGDVRIEDDHIVVHGRMNLHGVVHDVELRGSPEAARIGLDGLPRARFTAQGTIDRQSFGLHWNQDLDVGGIVVGDTIEISAAVELVRANGDSVQRRSSS